MAVEDLITYNMKECAALLHLTEGRVRQLIARGQLKGYVHHGKNHLKRLYVFESDLKQFIYENFLTDYYHGWKRPQKDSK